MITLSRIVPQYLPTQTRQVSCLQVYELNEFDNIQGVFFQRDEEMRLLTGFFRTSEVPKGFFRTPRTGANYF